MIFFSYIREMLSGFWIAHTRLVIGVGMLALVLLAGGGYIFFSGAGYPRFSFNSFNSFNSWHGETVDLVAPTISQGAAIAIAIPEYVSSAQVGASTVTFEPQIDGVWHGEGEKSTKRERVFAPKLPLALGSEYAAVLTTPEGVVKKNFTVVEAPKVSGVAPSGANSPAETQITVAFNRPMVALGVALGRLDSAPVPQIQMFPETRGVWKWQGTRMLQFTPETTLAQSAHYEVRIPKILSVEGLETPAFMHTFQTRALELVSKSEGTISASGAIQFTFNVPVALPAHTDVSLVDVSTNTHVGARVRYAKQVNDGGEVVGENMRVVEVVPSGMLRGVESAFEFDRDYFATLRAVMPDRGDIGITTPLESRVRTQPLILEARVEGTAKDASPLLSEQLFDPNSTVTYVFSDEIDLGASRISAPGLQKIAYGESCLDDAAAWYGGCTKREDAKRLILTFAGRHEPSGVTAVTFSRLVSKKGYTINTEPIVRTLTQYPTMQVRALVPAQTKKGVSLTDASLCSNVPLKTQNAEAFYKNSTANGYIVFSRFDDSYLVNYMHEGERCQLGEYATTIRYGLHPNKAYTLDLKVEGVFGGTQVVSHSFTTGSPLLHYLSLQALDKVYNVTTPDKTILTFAAENFGRVDVSLCKMAPEDFAMLVARAPRQMTTEPEHLQCIETQQDTKLLPPAQWLFHYFTVDVSKYFADPRGHYVVSLTNPAYVNESGVPRTFRSFLSVSNMTLVEKRVRHSLEQYGDAFPIKTIPEGVGALYIALNRNLSPVTGARATQIILPQTYNAVPFVGASALTDMRGVAEFPRAAHVVGAVVKTESDSAVVTDWADRVSDSVWGTSRQNILLYMYTDRPIYRPGHDVHIRGMFRTKFDTVFSTLPGETIRLEIRNPKWEVMKTVSVALSKNGTFDVPLTLPKDAPLGTYSISSSNGYASFDVKEYTPAPFEAHAETKKDEYTAGESLVFDVSGTYYFGAPVESGTLTYAITAQNYYFDKYTDEYFSFGSGWYSCYSCGFGDTFITSGSALLGKDGRTTLTQSLDFTQLFTDEKARDSSKILVLHGTIKDKKGKSVSFSKSVIVHRGEYYIGVQPEEFAPRVNTSFGVKVKTVDTSGKLRSVSGLTAHLYKISYESFARSEVDRGYYNYSERKRESVDSVSVRTDAGGNARVEFTPKTGGEYEIVVEGRSSGGTKVEAVAGVYVQGEGSVRHTNNATLQIAVDKKDANVGETVRAIVQNPFSEALMLASVERGGIYSYEVKKISDSVIEYPVAITREHIPNVFASVLLISPHGDVRFGSAEFSVGKLPATLSIETKTDKQSYTPGEKVVLTLLTKDSTGRGVPAVVSVAVADVSVLALAGNPRKDPLSFFYTSDPLVVQTSVNLKNILTQATIPTGTKGGDGGAGGDLAKRTRGEFKDTAFWRGDVETNANGVANVSFTLPDNLTRWQIEALGITLDTKVGVTYSEIFAQKELMAVVSSPRFIVPGDTFSFAVHAFNRTDEALSATLSVNSKTLALGSYDTTLSLPPRSDKVIYVPVMGLSSEELSSSLLNRKAGTVHEATVSLKSQKFEDTVIARVPVSDRQLFETVATMGEAVSTATEYVVVPEEGDGTLAVTLSNSLASLGTYAIEYLLQYPYGCAEQIASKLEGLLLAQKVVEESERASLRVTYDGEDMPLGKGIQKGLEALANQQNADGGFGYYEGLQSNVALTAQIVTALVGIPGAADMRVSAQAYLAGAKLTEHTPRTRDDVPLLTLVLDALVGSGHSARVNALYGEIGQLLGKTGVQYVDSSTLARLTLVSQKLSPRSAIATYVLTELKNRTHIDARGGYVEEKVTATRLPFGTPIAATADTVRVLLALGGGSDTLGNVPRMLRTLAQSSRNKSISTTDALAIARAFAAYSTVAEGKGLAEGGAAVLGGESFAEGTFVGKNAKGLRVRADVHAEQDIQAFTRNTLLPLVFTRKGSGTSPMYYDSVLRYTVDARAVGSRDEGLSIRRELYSYDETKKEPITEAKVGEVVRGRMTLTIPTYRDTLLVEDPIPAGFEIVDFSLATEDESLLTVSYITQPSAHSRGFLAAILGSIGSAFSPYSGAFSGSRLYPDFVEKRDDRVVLFLQNVTPGTYYYDYTLRASVPGTFTHLPAEIKDPYSPEIFGRSNGGIFDIYK